jgi:hypothetical protein
VSSALPLARPEDLREVWGSQRPGLGEYLGAQVREGFASTTPFQLGRAGAARGEELPTFGFEMGDLGTAVPSGLPSLEEAQGLIGDREELRPVLTGTQSREQIEALVRDYDARRARQDVIARRQPGLGESVLGLGAQLVGGVPDPINFLPLGGGAWRAAQAARAAGRMGALRAGAAAGAREGALGAAAAVPLVAAGERAIGSDYGLEDVLLDLATGAVVGGALGGAGQWWAARRPTPAATADMAAAPPTPEELGAIQAAVPPELADRAAQRINLAAEQVLGGAPVRAADIPAPAPEAQRMLLPRVAITARGREVPVSYEVRDLSELIASQVEDTLEANPRYPRELQPRDRSSAASRAQIQRLAKNLDARLLGVSPSAAEGAPIIDAAGNVLSGNGRVLALARAYADPGAAGRLGEYRAMMEALGYRPGERARPVLVRRADVSGEEARAVAREANERITSAKPAGKQAKAAPLAPAPERQEPARVAPAEPVARAEEPAAARPAEGEDAAAVLAAAEQQLELVPRDQIPEELRKELDESAAELAKAEAGADAYQAAAACLLRAA